VLNLYYYSESANGCGTPCINTKQCQISYKFRFGVEVKTEH